MKNPFASPKLSHLEIDLLSSYLDKRTTAAEQARVESHLLTCAACRAELASLRNTVALLAALPRVPVPHAFTLSEAKVGLRRAARPSWYGGLVRGLGAVTALALVVVVTATLVSRPGWTPGEILARQAAPTTAVAVEAPAPAAEIARVAAPEATAVEPPVEVAEAPAEAPPAAAPEAPAMKAAAPAEGVAAETEAAPAALAQDSAAPDARPVENTQVLPATVTEAPQPAELPADTPAPDAEAFAAAPSAAAEPSARAGAAAAAESAPAFGRGGGLGGAEGAPMAPDVVLTPEPTPAMAAIDQALPAGVRVAWTDLTSVWAIDRSAGARKLLDAEAAVTPAISSDGAWIAYRDAREGDGQLWVVRWDGTGARQVLDERTLPKDNLAPGYTARVLQSYRWVPRQAALAVNLVAVPVEGGIPRTELWRLNIATGELTYVTGMGRANTAVYSPDGTRFVLLEYGTEADPQGTLTLFSADGRERRVALSFPASPAKPMYDSQMQWLPNGRSLWVAIPTADPTGPTAVSDMNGATLYRVPVSGNAEPVAEVEAYQVYWSPDGTKLAYTQASGDAGDTQDLYLAAADGASLQLYGTLTKGMFLSWSPDGASFLYQDAYEVYVGSAVRKPQLLGNAISVFDPHWVSNRQIISRHDTGTDWLLTLRGVDGAAYGLLPLPREAELDIVAR